MRVNLVPVCQGTGMRERGRSSFRGEFHHLFNTVTLAGYTVAALTCNSGMLLAIPIPSAYRDTFANGIPRFSARYPNPLRVVQMAPLRGRLLYDACMKPYSILQERMKCPLCAFRCTVDACEPDCDGEGSLGCPQPDCGGVMREDKEHPDWRPV